MPLRSSEEPKSVSDTMGSVVVPYDMNWLRERLRELRKSGADMGRALNVPKARIYEMQIGKRKLQPKEIGPAARFLEWSEAEVVARLEGRAPPANSTQSNGNNSVTRAKQHTSDVIPVDRDIPPPLRSQMEKTVPVYGTVSGGSGGFHMNGDPIDWVRRPPRLADRKDIFALYVEDVSMVPAHRPGSLIFVERARPPQAGDDVVIELRPLTPSDEPKAILKCLVAVTPTLIKVVQHNPAKPLEFPRKQVVHMYRVMTMMDLLGV